MATNYNVPSTWYKYDFPLAENEKYPKPSNANYEPKNVAWLIEFFASFVGYGHDQLIMHYENNTHQETNDDKYVAHPLDKLYFYEELEKRKEKSTEMVVYELYAKRSATLINFEENSPANIQYFK